MARKVLLDNAGIEALMDCRRYLQGVIDNRIFIFDELASVLSRQIRTVRSRESAERYQAARSVANSVFDEARRHWLRSRDKID